MVEYNFLSQYPHFMMLSLIFLHKTKMKRHRNHKSAPCHIYLGTALYFRQQSLIDSSGAERSVLIGLVLLIIAH